MACRNGAKVRVRNRCQVTGRPRAYYPQAWHVAYCHCRDLGSMAKVPGLVKSSCKEREICND